MPRTSLQRLDHKSLGSHIEITCQTSRSPGLLVVGTFLPSPFGTSEHRKTARASMPLPSSQPVFARFLVELCSGSWVRSCPLSQAQRPLWSTDSGDQGKIVRDRGEEWYHDRRRACRSYYPGETAVPLRMVVHLLSKEQPVVKGEVVS